MSDLSERLRVVADVQDEIGNPEAAFTCRQAADALEAALLRLDSAENAMREVVSHLQRSQRGSTHWAGCTDVHPVCQAINMLVDALPLRDVERHVTNEETQ